MVGYDDRLYLFRQALRAGKFPNVWIPLGYAIGIAGEQEYRLAQTSKVAKSRKDPTQYIHQRGFTGARQKLDKVILYGLTAPLTPHHLYTVWTRKKNEAAAFPDGGITLVSQIWDDGFPFFQGHESAPLKRDSQFRAGLIGEYETVTLTMLLDGLIKASPSGGFVKRELWAQIDNRHLQPPTHALEYIGPKDQTKTKHARRPRNASRITSLDVPTLDGIAMDTAGQQPVGDGSSTQPFTVGSDNEDQDVDMQLDDSHNRNPTGPAKDRLDMSFDILLKTEKPTSPGNSEPSQRNGNQASQVPSNSIH